MSNHNMSLTMQVESIKVDIALLQADIEIIKNNLKEIVQMLNALKAGINITSSLSRNITLLPPH
ncbi:hypothetical protein WCSV-1gp3 [Water chestnut soymovirus 1]|uniref:Uncharacterized protein n=1 Tax=Water chestnut soymovirus 1 TaxID=1848040 RepID=A0A172PC82_9VIRU|nr:hypothetical protein WCSV-1gp3 [Water chestnut soymovirus 1]AND65750.1 hypothetical protein WCSV-1gp3 [Water chestnut soymovirus 1]